MTRSFATCTVNDKIGALAIGIFFGTFGGILVSLVFGWTVPSMGRFKGFSTKPLIERIRIPGLLG